MRRIIDLQRYEYRGNQNLPDDFITLIVRKTGGLVTRAKHLPGFHCHSLRVLRKNILRPLRGIICSSQKTQPNVIPTLWPPHFHGGWTLRITGKSSPVCTHLCLPNQPITHSTNQLKPTQHRLNTAQVAASEKVDMHHQRIEVGNVHALSPGGFKGVSFVICLIKSTVEPAEKL